MKKAEDDPLRRELDAYKRLLPSLLSEEGKFALIVGDELIAVFSAYEDALRAGYQHAKLKPFLVQRIASSEPAAFFARDVVGECLILPSA